MSRHIAEPESGPDEVPVQELLRNGRDAPGRVFGSYQRRGYVVLLSVLFLVAITVRLHHLDLEPYHVDEIRQAEEVKEPLADLIPLSYQHTQPPLDYIVGKTLTIFAEPTNASQRLPAAIFGALATVLVAHVLLRAGMVWAAAIAGCLASLHPLLVEYAQFARPYSIALFSVMATIAVYQHWRLGARTRVTVSLFVLVAALALLSRALMPVLALAVLGLVARLEAGQKEHSDLKGLVRADPLAMVVLPSLFLLVWIPSFALLAKYGGDFLAGPSLDPWQRLQQFGDRFTDYSFEAMRPTPYYLAASTAIVLSPLRSVRRALGRTRYLWIPLAATAPLFVLVHSLTTQSGQFFAIRYMVFLPFGASVFIGIVGGAILDRAHDLGPKRRAAVTSAVIVAVVIVLISSLSATMTRLGEVSTPDWRSVASHIEAVETPGDVIVVIDARSFRIPLYSYGFVAEPRYYSGTSDHLRPDDVILNSGSPAETAGRYHFVVFNAFRSERNPVFDFDSAARDGWSIGEHSGMAILTTFPLETAGDREGAWWQMAKYLRGDVSVMMTLAGLALAERTLADDRHPWSLAVSQQLEALGLDDFEKELLDSVVSR